MSNPSTLEQIARLLGVDPEDLDIDISTDTDDADQDASTEPDHVEAAERRLAESHPHLTQSERRRYAEQETPGMADFIAQQKQQTPPAHRDNPEVRELIERRKADREEANRRATTPAPKPYEDDDRPARSNVSGAYINRQADMRRQHEENRLEALAKQQQHLDEVATRRDRQAEASQNIADEIEALRKARRQAEKDAAKNTPKRHHV